MRKVLNIWLREVGVLIEDDKAATSIEYTMIASTVTLAVVFALSGIEGSLKTTLTSISDGLNRHFPDNLEVRVDQISDNIQARGDHTEIAPVSE